MDTPRLDYPFNGIGNTAVIPQQQSNEHTDPEPGIVYYRSPADGALLQVEHCPSFASAQSRAAYAESFFVRHGFRSGYRVVTEIAGRCLVSH